MSEITKTALSVDRRVILQHGENASHHPQSPPLKICSRLGPGGILIGA